MNHFWLNPKYIYFNIFFISLPPFLYLLTFYNLLSPFSIFFLPFCFSHLCSFFLFISPCLFFSLFRSLFSLSLSLPFFLFLSFIPSLLTYLICIYIFSLTWINRKILFRILYEMFSFAFLKKKDICYLYKTSIEVSTI